MTVCLMMGNISPYPHLPPDPYDLLPYSVGQQLYPYRRLCFAYLIYLALQVVFFTPARVKRTHDKEYSRWVSNDLERYFPIPSGIV